MDTKERRIEEVRRTIAEYEKSLQTQTTQLGCRLFADCDIAPRSLGGIVREAQGYTRDLEGYRASLAEIRGGLEKLDELHGRRRKIEAELDKIEKENAKLYLSIGTAFYSAYRNGEINQIRYKDLFGPAAAKEERLVKIQQDIAESEKSPKERAGFLKMVMDSGRRTLLQGNLAMQQRLFQKELQKAGQEICSSGLLDEEKGVALGAVARQFLENRELAVSLSSQKTSLDEEHAIISGKLRDLVGEKKPAVRIKELEAKTSATQKDLDRIFLAIGEKYLADPEKVNAPALSGDVDSIRYLHESVADKKKELERLLAMVEIDRLDRRVEELNLRIHSLEEAIKRQQEEIKGYRKEVSKSVKERDKLAAIAYPSDPHIDPND
jgi:hypothetical protein